MIYFQISLGSLGFHRRQRTSRMEVFYVTIALFVPTCFSRSGGNCNCKMFSGQQNDSRLPISTRILHVVTEVFLFHKYYSFFSKIGSENFPFLT